jgi:hypothetical protein
MLFAALWGVLQLAVLGSWTRTVRLSTLALVVATGTYGCGVFAVLLETVWTRLVALVTRTPVSSVVVTASYTIDPLIEELVKAAPLVALALLVPRLRRQLGLTDFVLLGAAIGAGFSFFEAALRHGTVRAMTTGTTDGYLVQASLGGVVTVPYPSTTMTTWLPEPAMVNDLFGTGDRGASLHLVWTALVGLGVGWLFRRTDSLRWLGLLPFGYAAGAHMHENYPTPSTLTGGWHALDVLLDWLGGGLGLYAALAVAVAVVLDRRLLTRRRAAYPLLLLPGEVPSGYAVGPLLAFARLRAPWTTLVATRFVLARRAAGYSADTDAALVGDVTQTRTRIERARDPGQWSVAISRLGLDPRALARALSGWPTLVWLVLTLPGVLYLVVGGFPATRGLQEAIRDSSTMTWAMYACALAGLVFLAWALSRRVRAARAAKGNPLGEVLARHLARLAAGVGALTAGGVLAVVGLRDRLGTAPIITNTHALAALSTALMVLGLALLLWALIMFPPFDVAVLATGDLMVTSAVTGELLTAIAQAGALEGVGILLDEAAGAGGGGNDGAGPGADSASLREQRLQELAKDPAHGGRTSAASRAEAEAGLGLEEGGVLRGPIRRSANPGEEFIDGNGQSWDVKAFRSDVVRRGRFTVDTAMESIGKEIRQSGNNVILDTRNLTADDVAALKNALTQTPDLLAKVVFYP